MIYLDTSALVKLIRVEAESAQLADRLDERTEMRWIASTLTEVELPRALIRAGALAGLAAVPTVLARLDKFEIDTVVRSIAAAYQNPALRSLDALHLATAAVAVPIAPPASGVIPAGTAGAIKLGVRADCGPTTIGIEHVMWMSSDVMPEWSRSEGYELELGGARTLRCNLVLGTRGEERRVFPTLPISMGIGKPPARCCGRPTRGGHHRRPRDSGCPCGPARRGRTGDLRRL